MADLIEVYAGLQRCHQRHANARSAQVFQRLQLDRQERLAAKPLVDRIVEAIELEVNFKSLAIFGQALDERGVMREADSIGVNHHNVDWPAAGVIEHFQELRMDRRLAA